MKLSYLKADILTIETNIICQSVNFQGVMGSGLALQIKNKYPSVMDSYLAICRSQFFSDVKVNGIVAWYKTPHEKYIASIFGQEYYRINSSDKRQYTDYVALGMGFETVKIFCLTKNLYKVAIPFNMGCDRGGGDWNVVRDIVMRCFDNTNLDVEICSKDN